MGVYQLLPERGEGGRKVPGFTKKLFHLLAGTSNDGGLIYKQLHDTNDQHFYLYRFASRVANALCTHFAIYIKTADLNQNIPV